MTDATTPEQPRPIAWCESCGFDHEAGWPDCIEAQARPAVSPGRAFDEALPLGSARPAVEPRTADWNEHNPDWWEMQVESRGDLAWEWLVNEWEAEAQARPVGGLDVERLARAMSVSLDMYGWDLDSMARDIAAAYDAEGQGDG